jgi:hypothetical protein
MTTPKALRSLRVIAVQLRRSVVPYGSLRGDFAGKFQDDRVMNQAIDCRHRILGDFVPRRISS